jgi:hypothetical protein
MSWFGFGGGDKKPESDRSSEVPVRIDDFDDSSFVQPSGGTMGGDIGGLGNGGSGSFQEQLMLEQQRMMMQAVMLKLTDMSFERCVTKPSSSLTYIEQGCITATVGKFVDTSQLVLKRFHMAQEGHK